jgi:NAD(P)H dehydrogenase (quinone)
VKNNRSKPVLSNLLLVIYYSKTGTTQKMANAVVKGAKDAGVTVTSKTVADCTIADLASADGIAFGSPTYYSNIAWQPKRFLDETILEFYGQGHSLRGKSCGCFTSTGACDDGKECLRMLERAFEVALKMQIVPGIVLETTEINQGNLAKCYDLGQKLAKQITQKV